mgnify:CR=1 FL=1
MIALVYGLSVDFEGVDAFERIVGAARTQGVHARPLPDRMEFFARQLIGTPYVGGTLERDIRNETCFVTLRGLDCVTFAETVLALARLDLTAPPTPADLVANVQNTRYRDGLVDGYLSRLHYTSDWFADNARRGTWTNITSSLPGARLDRRPISFMSANARLYPQLAADPSLLEPLREHEARITRLMRWYVPAEAARDAERHLQTGDIVGLVDRRTGMDYAHVGMIVRQRGVPHFVHASSTARKVVFDAPLSQYLARSRGTIGFSVVRPNP